MNTASSIFNFVTIRNATSEVKQEPKFEIQPKTEFVNSLVAILSSDQKQPEKIKTFNKCLSDFIKSKNFYKTKQELIEVTNRFTKSKLDKKGEAEINNFYQNIYNNIVFRIVTKSNTNEVFKLLTDSIKAIFQRLNCETVKIEDISDNENIIPLYCYGIGTLDFDLTVKQMKPLVELANIESERTTISYFANQK